MLGLTEDLGWLELECRAVVDGDRVAEVVEARGEDQRRGTPGCWAPWIASRGAYGGATGVKTTRGASTANNRDGGTTHRRRLLRESPTMQRLRAKLPSSGSF
jgi:hypothetical protein